VKSNPELATQLRAIAETLVNWGDDEDWRVYVAGELRALADETDGPCEIVCTMDAGDALRAAERPYLRLVR